MCLNVTRKNISQEHIKKVKHKKKMFIFKATVCMYMDTGTKHTQQ